MGVNHRARRAVCMLPCPSGSIDLAAPPAGYGSGDLADESRSLVSPCYVVDNIERDRAGAAHSGRGPLRALAVRRLPPRRP